MQQTLRTKLLIAILVALSAIALLIAHQLQVNHQTAASTTRLAVERDQAAHIDHDDWAAVQKIRERAKQKAAVAGQQ